MEKKKNELGKKSPKEIIESKSPELEQAYVKGPRGKLIPVSESSTFTNTTIDPMLASDFFLKRGQKPYLFLHTHPTKGEEYVSGIPSINDLIYSASLRDIIKTSVIAQRNQEGQVTGYTFWFNKLKARPGSDEIIDANANLKGALVSLSDRLSPKTDRKEYIKETIRIANENGFDMRFHPAKGYYFDENTGKYEKKPEHSLEDAVASILIGFVILFLLIKIPFTGFAIANVSSNSRILFPLILGFLLSLIAYFVLPQIKRLIEIEKSLG